MPWCDDCSKYWNDSSLSAAGACPSCGRVLTAPRKHVPWHFKVMLVAFCGYLAYRIYWFIEWLPKHI